MVSNGNSRNAGPGMCDITRPNFSGGCRIAQPINTSKLPHRHSNTTATIDKVFFDGFRIGSLASVLRSALAMNSSFGLGAQLHCGFDVVRGRLEFTIDDSMPFVHQPPRLLLDASRELRIQPAI